MIQLEISRTEYNFSGHLKFAGPLWRIEFFIDNQNKLQFSIMSRLLKCLDFIKILLVSLLLRQRERQPYHYWGASVLHQVAHMHLVLREAIPLL
jgi:hypothetical protein